MASTVDVDAVAKALTDRARTEPARAKKLATAYLDAATARAVAVTTARELPPTAMKASQVSLLVELLDRFVDDMPTAAELAALLRIKPSAARGLLDEVLATSDVAEQRLLKAIFSRAKNLGATAPDAPIPKGFDWQFGSRDDFTYARQRLEAAGIDYRTRKSEDGTYVLLVDSAYKP